MFLERGRKFFLIEKKRKYIRGWEDTCNGVDHTFAAGKRDKPVMYNCYPHSALKLSMRQVSEAARCQL